MKKSFWRNAGLPKSKTNTLLPNADRVQPAVPHLEIIENLPYQIIEDPSLALNLQVEAPNNIFGGNISTEGNNGENSASESAKKADQEELRKMIHEELGAELTSFSEQLSQKLEENLQKSNTLGSGNNFDEIKSDLQKVCREQTDSLVKRVQNIEDHFENLISEQTEMLHTSRKQIADLEEQIVHASQEIEERILTAEKHFDAIPLWLRLKWLFTGKM